MKLLKTIDTAVILAGGKGTRLSEQTKKLPKPLVDVQGKPIMVRIMEHLSRQGIKEFYILGGYMINEIYNYFLNSIKVNQFFMNQKIEKCNIYISEKEMTFNIVFLDNTTKYVIRILDTGWESGTAERMYMIKDIIDSPFVMTYGDSYSDVEVANIEEQLTEDRIMSLCAIPYKERFGLVKISNENKVEEFKEKSESKIYFVNGGFICMKPEIFNIIKENHFDLSKDSFESPELNGKIGAYIHRGYWKAVDTQRDLDEINKHFEEGVIK